MDLPDKIRTFLTEANRFAAVATIDPDGAPRQTFVWYGLDPDDRLRINSRSPRRWWSNLLRDGRLAVAIADAQDQDRWVGLEGVVDEVISGTPAQDDIIAFAYRYHVGAPPEGDVESYRTQDRYTFLVRITGAHDHLE